MVNTSKPLSLLVLLLFCSIPINALSASVRIPSGRTLPLTLINEHFPSFPTAHAVTRFYEITRTLHIIGQGLNVSIHAVTDEPKVIRHKPTTTIFNGEKVESEHLHLHIRRGQIRVAHTPDGTVLGVWGPKISLQPVDLVNHPGIYVNILSSNTFSESNEHSAVKPKQGMAVDMISGIGLSFEREEQAIHQSLPVLSRASTCERKSRSKMVEIAVAFSSRQCKKYGSFGNTATALLALFTIASEPFEFQTCLFLKVTTFDGYCSPSGDPYRNYKTLFSKQSDSSSIDFAYMLIAFGKFWYTNRKFVKRDLAYFMPSFDDLVSTDGRIIGGQTYVGSVCNKRIGYGWALLTPTEIAHEIGHNFNASHSHAGIMKASINTVYPPAYFMTSSANTISRYAETRKCLGQGNKAAKLRKTKQTCGFRFPEQIGFACKKSQLPTFSWSQGVVVQKHVSLESGKIKVSLKIKRRKSSTMRFRFRRVMLHVSTDHTLAEENEMKEFTSVLGVRNNSPKFSKKVSANGLDAKPGWSTCCGKSVSIYVYVEIETYKSSVRWSGEASKRYSWKLPCTSCSTKVQPMSGSRKCPSCSKHDPRLRRNKTGSK